MKNDYEIRGNTVAIFLYSKGKHIETLIDLDDFDKVNDFNYKWSALFNPHGQIYAILQVYNERRTIYLHRLILPSSDEMEVDHRDGNGLNNRKSNLRETTHAENMQNLRLRADNTSGVRGVSWNKRKCKWETNVRIDNKIYKLGCFSKLQDAAETVANFREAFMPFSNEGGEYMNGLYRD